MTTISTSRLMGSLILAGIVSVSASVAGASEASLSTSRPAAKATLSEKIQRLDQPTTARGLFANLNMALEEGWFLSEAFYTEDNLRQFFGVPAEIKRIRDTGVLKMVDLRGFDYMPVRDKARFTISLIRELVHAENSDDAEHVVAAISLACTCPTQLRLEDVDAVWGSLRRTVTDEEAIQAAPPDPAERFPHSYPVLPTPTDPMGNKRVTYMIPTPSAFKSTLVVVFDPGGNIRLVAVNQSEER